jgi:sigma-E factor negative regulatory protein RseC
MIEHASVVSINNNGSITVACNTTACESCGAGALCQVKGKQFIAGNETKLDVAIGDTVELYLPPGRTVFAAFMALLVPLILFPVGYYLAAFINNDYSEVTRVLFGAGGIAVGFLISRVFSHLKAKDYTPQITRVVELD